MTDFLKRADLCKTVFDNYRPFEGHMLEQVKKIYRVSTTWSSNALEGNTLTESETKVILEVGHKQESVFIDFIAEAEYETEKDFLRMVGGKIPEFKDISSQ